MFADKFRDIHPWEWIQQAFNTIEEATQADMVEAIAESHF